MSEQYQGFSEERRVAMTLGTAALVAGMAASGAAAAPRKPTTEAEPSLEIRSPRDGYVLQANPTAGMGEIVAELDPQVENDAIARIDLALLLVAEQQANFTGDALKWQMVPLDKNIEIAKEYARQAKHDFEAAKILSGAPGIVEAHAILMRADAELAKCNAAANLFDFQVTQALKQLQQAQDALNKRRAALQSDLGQLKLTSPQAGPIQLRCYKGAFVQRGQVLATVG
jgi:multidrug resistance efflux pump